MTRYNRICSCGCIPCGCGKFCTEMRISSDDPPSSGAQTSVQFLTAYSTPAAPGTAGNALDFDLNGSSSGTAVSHTAGSADITLNEPGTYVVAFQGNLAPASGANFPLSIFLNLQQDGTNVPGAVVQHTFQASSDTATVAFSSPVTVTGAPSVLRVVGTGGNFIYSAIAMTVYKIA